MKKIVVIILLVLIVFGTIFFLVSRKKSGPRVASDSATDISASSSEPAVDLFPDDSDRDGIRNEEEKTLGLDATDFDTDGDGLSDYNELHAWKSNPKKEDTDNDGFLDGAEVFDGYNPAGPGRL